MIRCPKCNRMGVERVYSRSDWECLWRDCNWRDANPPPEVFNAKDSNTAWFNPEVED